MAVFSVESEAYQAFTELRQGAATEGCVISQAVLVKRADGILRTKDAFDTGLDTTDDTWTGTLIGSCVGILGGPLGVLLGGSLGAAIGYSVDADDIMNDSSLLERIAAKVKDESMAILALVQEDDRKIIDDKLAAFKAAITRYDAAEVQSEVDEAERVQQELAKEARAKLRKEKSDERKAKLDEYRKKIAADFEALKGKLIKK